MWAEINGERKKVACGPCIRGHRSSKCDHRDRVLVEVRKPGRPLSSCPHPSGSCSCERVVINYTIPKTSECACPPDRAQPPAASTNSGRIQKSRTRKGTGNFNSAALEKAIKSAQDVETDASSLPTGTPTTGSTAASAPSSASSTPRLPPSRKASQDLGLVLVEPAMTAPRPTPSKAQRSSSFSHSLPQQPVAGGCCGNRTKEPPKPKPTQKSCCSGSAPAPTPQHQYQPPGNRPYQGQFPPYPAQFHQTPYGMVASGNHFIPMAPPYNFNTPIYNHIASVYQTSPVPMAPVVSHAGTHGSEHNCHCGDSCSCFGCAAHPNNATMIEYIRSMHQYMSTGQFGGGVPPPIYDLPIYPHQAGYGAEAGPTYHSPAPNFLTTGQMSFQANINATMSMPQAPLGNTNPWLDASAQTPVQASSPTQHNFFGIASNTMPATAPEIVPTHNPAESAPSPVVAESPGDSKSEEAETLSPSSFFWQEVVLPGCDDATGTCQCGDGCDCVGCLTHGGHNGVQLELSTGAEEGSFPDLASPTTANNHPDSFNAFSEVPA